MSTNATRREFVCSGLALAAGGFAIGDAQAQPSSSKKTVTEPAREIPVFHETDVVVCGGGPAGVAAAIAAARNGADTVLVEYQICLGGMAGSGMLNRLGPFHDQRKMIVGGIPWEILQRLIAMEAASTPYPCSHDDPSKYWIPFDPEAMKYVLDRMVDEAGVKVLFHSSFSAAIVPKKGEPRGVIVETKSGRQAILAKVIIDATGDADVAASAGASYEKGRREDGLMQPTALMYKISNLDRDKAKDFLATRENRLILLDRAQERAKADGEEGEQVVYVGAGTDNLLKKDETYYNNDMFRGVDATDVEQLSDAVMKARKVIWEGLICAKKYTPGFEDAYLGATASKIGVRETRRIVGEYVLTAEDVLGVRKFDDAISQYACYVDIHMVESRKTRDLRAGKALEPGTSYDIPYRCLIPKKINNLLVAGRCFSATHEALASARMMPSCMAMGQAAGTAAALAAKQNIGPRELGVKQLQDVLRKQDVKI
jgi:ribulose 1,5-bisphosphate synthetase/thiazole synthase